MNLSSDITAAMRRALELAAKPGVPLGPNPRVGCVLVSPTGTVVGEGFHRGAGSPHAEVVALHQAGPAAAGATAVVTLEPCNHTGRTPPCSQALIDSGVAKVIYAMPDPTPAAAGGAATLQAAGVAVISGLESNAALHLNRAWLHGLHHDRPLVTWKFAASLDGRIAAQDGTSQWISSASARRDVHQLRAQVDTILVGTGTAIADNPSLTIRDEEGTPVPHQPVRAVMGKRKLPESAHLLDSTAATMILATRDPHAALAQLFAAGRRHVLLEGGATLAAAFLQAGLVDELIVYVAPVLLGTGLAAVGDLGVTTLADAHRFRLHSATVVGEGGEANVKLLLRPKDGES